MSSRKTKSQRKQSLRKKNLGVGIGKIDIDSSQHNKTTKILFADDFVASDIEHEAEAEKKQNENANLLEEETSVSGDDENKVDNNDDDNDSDSDGEMEQISASAAKQQAMEMFAAERETRKQESAISNKRKRKSRANKEDEKKKYVPSDVSQEDGDEDEDEDEDFDDDFFAAVDEERRQEAKAQKAHKDLAKLKVNKHTTFVSEMDDPNLPGTITAPIEAGHNIEVVVLPGLSMEDGANGANGSENGSRDKYAKDRHDLALSGGLGTEPSSTALLFCRGSQTLKNESAQTSEKGFKVKRSRNAKYKLKRGRPSSHFANRKRR